MPLFCTLKNQYAGTNTPPADRFVDRGYPLMFEGKNKHMFFLDPEDTTKTVQKFYGAPLDVAHGALCYNNSLPSGQQYYNDDTGNDIDIFGPIKRFEVAEPTSIMFGGSFRMFKKLEVNDHKINVVTTQVRVQEETQLSINAFSFTTVHTDQLKHEDNISLLNDISVSNHKITKHLRQIKLPSETPVTITDRRVGDDYPSNGGSFQIVHDIRKESANGSHEISNLINDVYLPEYHLNLLDSSQNVINETGSTNLGSDPYLAFWEKDNSGDGTNLTINKIKFNDCTWTRSSNIISIKPTHNALHTLTTTSNSFQGNIQLSGTGCSGNIILTGSAGVTVRSTGSSIIISAPQNTDTNLSTISTNNTTYLVGKSAQPSTSTNTSTGYGNPDVYMNSGNLYAKHFYATTPNAGVWNQDMAAAIEITGNDSGSQTPIFRVKTPTGKKCQLEFCEKFDTMRLYKSGSYAEFPDSGINGKIPISTAHSSNDSSKLVKDIRVVTALPSDAGSYPNTLFLVTGWEEVIENPSINPTLISTKNMVQININTGVQSINVNGTDYTSSQQIFVSTGDNVTWTATAKTGYYMNTVSGTINNITKNVTISPTATKNIDIIDPTISFQPINDPRECPYFSTTRTNCHFTSMAEKGKYICFTNCGAADLSILT